MLEADDLIPLREVSSVEYREVESITEEDLAHLCKGVDYLMLNMDAVPKNGYVKLID